MSPDESNLLGGLIARSHRAEAEAKPLPVVGNAWFRASNAHGCARALAYGAAGVAQTNPPDTASYHSFSIGHSVHDIHQKAILEHLDETALIELEGVLPEAVPTCARVEEYVGSTWTRRCVSHNRPLDPTGDCPEQEGPRPLLGCHVDAVIWDAEGVKCAVEIKSVNEFAYADAVLKGNGPRISAIVQGALNAKIVGAEKVIVVYIPLTVVSRDRAERKGVADQNRYGAQWEFPRERWQPLADLELARIDWVRRTVLKEGPQAVIRWWSDKEFGPDDDPQVIRDPENTNWPCGWCNWKDRCVEDGA